MNEPMAELMNAWWEWELVNPNKDSKITELHSDGSGIFTEKDLYGPEHAFESIEHLTNILILLAV